MTEFLVASRDCYNNLRVAFFTYMQFFFKKRAFLRAVLYLTLLNSSSLKAGKEMLALVVHMVICREEKLLFCAPKELMYCFRLINADHSCPVAD